ncbi:glycosyltransferase [Magnetofaba australis]|nr:glycosyltransferase [Magnetofaba australis]
MTAPDTTPAKAPRIAFFLPSLSWGGAEHVFAMLANDHVAQGAQVTMVACTVDGPWLELLDPRIAVVNLNVPQIRHAPRPLRRWLKENPQDSVISCMTHANIMLLLAVLYPTRLPVRCYVQEVALLTVGRAHRARSEQVMRWIIRWLYPKADGVLVVSDAIADELAADRGKPLHNVISLPNPLDFAAIENKAAAPVDHPWLGGDDGPILLAVGRLAPEKDFSTLLHAFAQLRATQHRARLIILGEGPLREELTGLCHELGIAEAVDLHGFCDNPYAYMSRCDLFVVSSIAEGFSLVLVEAMRCGCRIVTTDCGPRPREFLDNGRLGQITPPGDIAAMASAMQMALDASHDAKILRDAVADFDIAQVAQRYLAVYGGN